MGENKKSSKHYVMRPAATLFFTAVVTVTLLSVVYTLTLDPIERQKQKTQEAAMREVLPGVSEYREITSGEKKGSIVAVYEGVNNGVPAGYVVQLSPQGYSGNVDLLVGISSLNKKLTGMRVLKHTETPGLGALAVKEAFYKQYEGKELVPLGVVRHFPDAHEINAITSATITSRAITGAVNEAIEWYKGSGK